MTERTESRPFAGEPREIPPNPDGNLPPCEGGNHRGGRCRREATWLYGYGTYCAEHLSWIRAGEEEDEIHEGLYHARRMLWQAQVVGIDSLEEHLHNAVGELSIKLAGNERHVERLKAIAEERPES